MNWPGPSTCSWVHKGHVAAFREEEFHAFQASWCSSPQGPWCPRAAAPHTPPGTPRAADLAPPLLSTTFIIPNAAFIAHCTQCSRGTGENTGHGVNSYLISTLENTRRSICFICISFSSAYCISWSTPEAQGSVGLFKTLCGRGHAPMSQSHLVWFEMPADGKHVK